MENKHQFESERWSRQLPKQVSTDQMETFADITAPSQYTSSRGKHTIKQNDSIWR